MDSGGQCVMITGTMMMHQWSVDNWGSKTQVNVTYIAGKFDGNYYIALN